MRASNFVRIADPGAEAVAQQLRDIRARHEDALVDVEALLAQPGLVEQIGERNAAAHPLGDQPGGPGALGGGQLALERGSELFVGNTEDVNEEPGRLVAGAVRAVAEMQPRAPKARLGVLQPVAQGRAGSRLRRSHASRAA